MLQLRSAVDFCYLRSFSSPTLLSFPVLPPTIPPPSWLLALSLSSLSASLAMSDQHDLFQTSPPTEAFVTAPQPHLHPLDDASQSAISAASQHEHLPGAQFSAQPNPLVEFSPPYDEDDDEDDFNVCAPRRSTDRSMLYPKRHGAPQGYAPSASSVSSTATNTPFASRTASPQPFDYSGASSCDSDSDSEPDTHLLPRALLQLHRREGRHRRWWSLSFGSRGTDHRRYRRWRDAIWGMRTCRRVARRCVRHPLFPKTPVTIVRVFPPVAYPLCTPHPSIARRRHRPARVCAHMLRRARSARCVLRASVHGTPLCQTRFSSADHRQPSSCSRSSSSPSSVYPSPSSLSTSSTRTRTRCHGAATARSPSTRAARPRCSRPRRRGCRHPSRPTLRCHSSRRRSLTP